MWTHGGFRRERLALVPAAPLSGWIGVNPCASLALCGAPPRPSAGLYFHPTLQQWGTYNHASQQFVPYEDPSVHVAGTQAIAAAAAPGMSTAAQSALAMTNATLYVGKVQQPAAAHHQQQHYHPPRRPAAAAAGAGAAAQQPAKRKGAVIGAAPKLDPQVGGAAGPQGECLGRW